MKMHLTIAVTLAVAAGCGGIKITTDYDHDTDFSQYNTYAWHEGSSSDIQDTDPLNHERLVTAIDTQMQQHGFRKADQNPDVYITYHGEDKTQTSLDTNYMGGGGWGYGGGWRWGGGGMGMGTTTTTVRQYTVGTIILDMWDAQKKQLVWRATASDTVSDNPQKNAETIRKAATKLFEHYPPSGS